MEKNKKIAVITGASSGLGKEFVKQISALHTVEEIWVIARRKELLEQLQETTDIPVKVLPLDLTKTEDIYQLENAYHAELPDIKILVNAAGMGKTGPFETQTLSSIHAMMDLNCKALIDVTKISIPFLSRGSTIYQISSIASFQPMPNFAIYSASKAFVTNFSLALQKELQPKGVHVVCVCPYWVTDTQFISIANTTTYYKHKVITTTSDHVVQKALRKRNGICTPDIVSTLERGMSKVLPHSMLACIMQKISTF